MQSSAERPVKCWVFLVDVELCVPMRRSSETRPVKARASVESERRLGKSAVATDLTAMMMKIAATRLIHCNAADFMTTHNRNILDYAQHHAQHNHAMQL